MLYILTWQCSYPVVFQSRQVDHPAARLFAIIYGHCKMYCRVRDAGLRPKYLFLKRKVSHATTAGLATKVLFSLLCCFYAFVRVLSTNNPLQST